MKRFRTPLRYPGGKQKLVTFIREILRENEISGAYCEPYAGGAGVAMELIISEDVKQVYLNDSFYGVYCFWNAIKMQPDEFCRKIFQTDISVEEWRRQKEILKSPNEHSELEVGFSTFYLNRCNRSGVLNAGVIGGNAQNGNYKIDARFNKSDLVRRIEIIADFTHKIHVSNLDAEEYLVKMDSELPVNSLTYLDPPYYVKGSELYLNSYKPDDHKRLAEKIKQYNKNWILSYDGVDPVLELYLEYKPFLYNLQYSLSGSSKGREVFFFGNDVQCPKSSEMKSINDALLLQPA